MKDILMGVAFALCLFLTFACAVLTAAFSSDEDTLFALLFVVLTVVFFKLTRRLLRAVWLT